MGSLVAFQPLDGPTGSSIHPWFHKWLSCGILQAAQNSSHINKLGSWLRFLSSRAAYLWISEEPEGRSPKIAEKEARAPILCVWDTKDAELAAKPQEFEQQHSQPVPVQEK